MYILDIGIRNADSSTLKPAPNKSPSHHGVVHGFSLIELLTVVVIISILLAVSVQVFSDSSHRARQASRDLILAHLQQARAHAISTGNATALAIPVLDSGNELGARAVSLVEVEKIGEIYSPITDENGDSRLLQRWETFPGDFRFIPASVISSSRPTIVDFSDTLETSFRGKTINCHAIVFSPNGQIVQPATVINIVIAKATKREGSLVVTERTGGKPVYESLEVNRLTGRTRSLQP